MNDDALFAGDELDLFLMDIDEVVVNYRHQYGEYRLGRLEQDPDMSEYEDTVELGRSLAGCRRGY